MVLRDLFLELAGTPYILPGIKLEPILPSLPALTSFEDGTQEPWMVMHIPCDSHINH